MTDEEKGKIVMFPGQSGAEPEFVKADQDAWAWARTEHEAALSSGDVGAIIGAELHLLHMSAPDLAALRIKLEILWGDELWAEDDEGHARRTIIGDLRRFEYSGPTGTESLS